MSGGGMGGMGGFGGGYGQQRSYGGYGQGFGGYGQGFGGYQSQGQPQGFGGFGQGFGGGNPWMRQSQGQQFGNKMGFQGYGQPQTGGTFEFQEGQRQLPRNDMRVPPQQSFTPPPLGANEGMQVAPPMESMAKPMMIDQAKSANIYGPQGGMSPPGAYDAMVNQGQQEYDARFKLPAQFGRYADGTPREDPNQLNARGQAHQQWYGGGWGR